MSIRQLAAALLATLSLVAMHATAAVDANQASQPELETVKGIGPGLSGKIVAARQQSAFKDWPDLVDRVGGVGPGNAARFSQAGLTVAGKSYSPQAAGPSAAAPAAATANATTTTTTTTNRANKQASAAADQAAPPAARKPGQP